LPSFKKKLRTRKNNNRYKGGLRILDHAGSDSQRCPIGAKIFSVANIIKKIHKILFSWFIMIQRAFGCLLTNYRRTNGMFTCRMTFFSKVTGTAKAIQSFTRSNAIKILMNFYQIILLVLLVVIQYASELPKLDLFHMIILEALHG
jgi:hypothetical protein